MSQRSSMPDAEDTLIPPHCGRPADGWADIGLTLTGYPPPPKLYSGLLRETQRLQANGSADLWFFIHKPPGIRWRLHASAATPLRELRRAATAAAARTLGRDRIRSAVYEPQQALFGGASSMGLVHQTWCADSLLWMRWHAENPHSSVTSRWDLSFAVLGHVFARLGVVGWEDREVWDHVIQDTGRYLAEHEWTRPEVLALASSLRRRWHGVWSPVDPAVGSRATDRVLEFSRATGGPLAAWYSECLSRPVTHRPLTPRRAAAYWTVFHWNRAGLSAAQQALAAQALVSGR